MVGRFLSTLNHDEGEGRDEGTMKYGVNPIGRIWVSAFLCAVLFISLGASFLMAAHTVTKTEDIRNTKHYFVANPDINAVGNDAGTSEVCIFCHTPHGSNPVVGGQAPLWNRRVPNFEDTDFQVYTAPNLEQGTAGKPVGISLACLSCHDGTIALDAIINAPGSGGFLVNNLAVGKGGDSSPIITLTGPGLVADSMSELLRDQTEGSTTPFSPFSGGLHDVVFQTGSGAGDEGMAPFPNLTQDLKDDHPISIAIPADTFAFGGTSAVLRDPQFAPIGANSPPPSNPGTSIRFITRSAGIYPFDKRDRIRAYPSDNTNYFVECATCHNPHTPRVNMLRLPSFVPRLVTKQLDPSTPIEAGIYDGEPWGQYPNNQSAICLTCHAK